MAQVLEILKYTLPAIIVFLTAWLMIKKQLIKEEDIRNAEIRSAGYKTILPIRLQAYERLALFLERISPESLVLRTNTEDMPARQLHSQLLNTIRSEFEHNMSQQVYVSQHCWELTKNAKGNMISVINSAAEQVKDDASSLTFSRKIFEVVMEHKEPPTAKALDYLRQEIQELF